MSSHAVSVHGTMQLIAGQIRRGVEPSEDDLKSLRVVKAYCEAILEGESVDPDAIYHRAFGKEAA